jgi:hypothetical protein
MSIFVEGSQVLSVSFQLFKWSVLSVRFDSLALNSWTNPLLIITAAAGQHHSISFPPLVEVSNLSLTDLILGLDWAAFLRNSLLGLGYCIDSSFNAWRFVSDPTHPILNGVHALHSILSHFGIHRARHLVKSTSPALGDEHDSIAND